MTDTEALKVKDTNSSARGHAGTAAHFLLLMKKTK